MHQLLELLLRPFSFLDVEWLQQASMRKRVASFLSNAAAGLEGAAATVAVQLVTQPWDEMGKDELRRLLQLPTTAASGAEASGPGGNDMVLSVADALLSRWEAAVESSPDSQNQYKVQIYRCELAVLSRRRTEAEAAMQQVKQLLHACEQQQLLQPQAQALVVAAEAYVVLGQPARARASLQQAIEIWQKAAATDPIVQAEETARAQLLLAELLLVDRQTDAAGAAAAEPSNTLGPTYKASELMAKISERQKKHAEAARHYAAVRTQEEAGKRSYSSTKGQA